MLGSSGKSLDRTSQRENLPGVSQVVSGWLAGVAPASADVYQTDWHAFTAWWLSAGGTPEGFFGATYDDAVEYRQHLIDGGLGAAAIGRRLAALSSLWQYVAREATRRSMRQPPNPWAAKLLKRPAVRDTVAERSITMEEMDRILDAARHNPRWHALVATLYLTGLRISALVEAEWRQVIESPDGKGWAINALTKGGKTILRPLPREAYNALAELVPARRGWLIPDITGKGHMTRQAASEMIHRVAKAAHVDKAVTSHWLRHAFATHSHWQGASARAIQHALGHVHLQTTERYIHPREDEDAVDYLLKRERETGE